MFNNFPGTIDVPNRDTAAC